MRWRDGMKLPDPIGLREKLQQTHVISVTSQFSKEKKSTLSFSSTDDCFVLSRGSMDFPHPEIAAEVTSSSVLWALSLLKSHHSYWRDKKLVVGRIIRSVNWTLYNKRKEPGFEEGLGSIVGVLLFGEKYFFVISVGISHISLIRNKTILPLVENSESILGIDKKEPPHIFYSDKLHSNDIFIMSSHALEYFSVVPIIQKLLPEGSISQESLQKSADAIAGLAKKKKLAKFLVSIVTYL